jgi:glycosyltransferase involved in cell wall biosynthesis
VYYCHKATAQEQAKAGFGVAFDWDVPLLSGYSYSFLKNVANPAGHGRFGGFDTPEIGEIIRDREYDAVLVNGWNYKSAWQAIWAAWQSNVKVLVRGDSHLHTRRSTAKRVAKWLLYRRFIPRFDACLAVGQWSREYFLHYGARPERIFSVPHVVDLVPSGMTGEDVRRQFREAARLDPDAVTFLFCGKFIKKKRPMDFVRAIAKTANGEARIQGLMVGDGPLRSGCEDLAMTLRAPVRFAGFLNQSTIWRAYVASDVLVLPSDGEESWGLVVNEAMACGKPCIVSDHVGCGPDLVQPCATGKIYPLGDVQTLAALMKQFASDPTRLAHMSNMARLMAQKFPVESAVRGVLDSLAASVGAQESVCAS